MLDSAGSIVSKVPPSLKPRRTGLNYPPLHSGLRRLGAHILKNAGIGFGYYAERHRIVAKVDDLMTLCDRLKARLQTAQTTQLHLAKSLDEAAIH